MRALHPKLVPFTGEFGNGSQKVPALRSIHPGSANDKVRAVGGSDRNLSGELGRTVGEVIESERIKSCLTWICRQ